MFRKHAKSYAELLLKKFKCTNISVQDPLEESDLLVCGFTAKSATILQDILQVCIPKKMYHAGQHQYILIFSFQQLVNFIENQLKDIVLHALPPGCGGNLDNDYEFLLYDQSSYQMIIHPMAQKNLERLRQAGIDYGYEEKASLPTFPVDPSFWSFIDTSKKTYYYLLINNMALFFEKTFPIEMKQMLSERAKRQAFLQGSVSLDSPVKNFTHHEYFDRNVLKTIFKFHAAVPKKIPSKVIECNVADEKHEQAHVKDIQNRIVTLQKENKDNSDKRKNDKISFLKLILSIKNANNNFALAACVEIAKENSPDLYKQAIKGVKSKTEKLLNSITSVTHKKLGKSAL